LAPTNECYRPQKAQVSVEAQPNTTKLTRFITGFGDWMAPFRRLITCSACGKDADRRLSKRKSPITGPSYANAAHPMCRAVEPGEPPLFRKDPLTRRALTAYWIHELLASDERIRRSAGEDESFMEALQLAHSSQASSEDDAQMVLIVEKFQAVLSEAFAVERGRQSNV